jgi:RAC serine/threonine-protein kinase/serum/glucocorticoid-regulated kinase 2
MSSIDFAGFLEKEGGKLVTRNQTRYFEIRGSSLVYYKTKPVTSNEEALGVIDLTDTKMVDNAKGKHSWTVTGPKLAKSYVLSAASAEEKNTWITKLSNPAGGTANVAVVAGGDDDDTMLFAAGGGTKKMSTEDFDVIRVIGKGSFGVVREVRLKATGQVFAMKEMSKEVIERENLVEHIFAEKSILQKINHPFVVTLHFAFQTKEHLYLILDFLSGGELFFHLSQQSKFDEYRAKFYAAEMGLAIGHLHSLDIIYRDLKPENAVLTQDGHVCLTDFGLAKTNVKGANSALTFCGTPEYLAPEFLMDAGHGKAVDWWSLGIFVYEMLCGIPPFYSENVNEMYELILQKPLEFPPGVNAAAMDLCTKLLDRNPETRMHTVEAYVAHPWFADMNFTALMAKELPVPFMPDQDPTNNFDPEFTGMKARLSISNVQSGAKVAGFTFEGNSGGGLQ